MKLLKVLRAVGSTAHKGLKVIRYQSEAESFIIQPEARETFKSWAQSLCHIFEIRVHLDGHSLDSEPGLFVGNHSSYLDIPVICSLEPMSFVAKAEMQKWPIVGKVGTALGTIFHDRKDSSSKRSTAEVLKRALGEEGKKVCVFPEGTTSLRGLPWRPGVFSVAQELGVPLQAFCIRYRPANRAAFESRSMLKHSLKLNSEGHLDVFLTLGPKIQVSDPIAECKKWDAWNKSLLLESLRGQGL